MKKGIKELRIKIDGLSQLVKELKGEDIRNTLVGASCDFPWKNSQECFKAYDSLILAKAWLGKILGELGEDTPYKNDGNRKTVEDIEPTSDTKNEEFTSLQMVTPKHWDNITYIEKIDWLREEIKKLITMTSDWDRYKKNTIIETYFLWMYKYLSEARFWLGFELQRIKENN